MQLQPMKKHPGIVSCHFSARQPRSIRSRLVLPLVGVILFGVCALGAASTFEPDSAREARQNAADRLVNADAIHQQIKITHDSRTGVFHAIINGRKVSSKQFGVIEKEAQRRYPGVVIEFIDEGTEQLVFTMPRTMLGVIIEPITGLAASQLQIPEGQAIVLEKVFRGLPAAEANLHQYDIILSCNGQSKITKPIFTKILTSANPGDHLNLVILRGGQEYELQVELKEYDPIRSRELGAQQNTPPLNAARVSLEELARSLGNQDLPVAGSNFDFTNQDNERIFFEIEGDFDRLPTGLQQITTARVGTIELIQENERLHRDLKGLSVQVSRLEELLKMLLVERFGEIEVNRRIETLPQEKNSTRENDR